MTDGQDFRAFSKLSPVPINQIFKSVKLMRTVKTGTTPLFPGDFFHPFAIPNFFNIYSRWEKIFGILDNDAVAHTIIR